MFRKSFSVLILTLLLTSMLTLALNIQPVKTEAPTVTALEDHVAARETINMVGEGLPPIAWNQTYGGVGDDGAYALVQTSDGGYALAGYTGSFGALANDSWLVKTDDSGINWEGISYGGTKDDELFSVVQTSDGGYALAGGTYSFGAGSGDFWLIKNGGPEPPPAGASMWIEPPIIDLFSTPVGFKFNVTVWLETTSPANCWQSYFVYEKEYLSVARCNFTGNGKSLWSGSNPTFISAGPSFGQHDSTRNYVLLGEILGSSAEKTGSGSLAWIEFQVMQVPNQTLALELRLDLIGHYSSFVVDKDFNEIGTNFGKATVIFNPLLTDTEIVFSLSPNPACVGQMVTLLGNLTDRLGQPINNTEIDLFVNGAFAGNLYTNSSGWFQASSKVSTPRTYNVTAYYYGSQDYNPSVHSETLDVFPKLDTKVSFILSPNPANVGQTVNLPGNLTDINNGTIAGAPLEVYLKVGAGPWQYTATIYTNSLGWFSVSGKVTSPGSYQIAVLYRGSYRHNLSYHIETLTVNP